MSVLTIRLPDDKHERLKALGYRHVSVDLAGYRRGSLNPNPA